MLPNMAKVKRVTYHDIVIGEGAGGRLVTVELHFGARRHRRYIAANRRTYNFYYIVFLISWVWAMTFS